MPTRIRTMTIVMRMPFLYAQNVKNSAMPATRYKGNVRRKAIL